MPIEHPPEEILAPEKEISPEDIEFFQDSLRVADALVKVEQGRIISLEQKNQELREENEKLRKLLGTDKLTGIQNEVGFRESVERRKMESGGGFSLAYFDAERFKSINDELGHEAGDFVIQEIAKYLQGIIRASDVVARFHGDEFVVIFSGATEEELAKKFEGKKFAFTTNYNGREIPVTLTAGIAESREGETIEATLRRADLAMLAAKTPNQR